MSTPIEGHAILQLAGAKRYALDRDAPLWYVDLADDFYEIGWEYGIRADVAWIQSCHETGFGYRHTGPDSVLNPSYCNPCGLKTPGGGDNQDPNAHTRFPTWRIGIRAQYEHLGLYAGVGGFPRPYKKISGTEWSGCADPRHFPYLMGDAPTVEALSGKWAGAGYGERLVEKLNGAITAYAA